MYENRTNYYFSKDNLCRGLSAAAREETSCAASLSTYWGDDPFKRIITLKVQGVNREELLMMLEWTIEVQVIDFCESRVESQPGATLPATNTEVFPNQNPDAKIPWLLDSK